MTGAHRQFIANIHLKPAKAMTRGRKMIDVKMTMDEGEELLTIVATELEWASWDAAGDERGTCGGDCRYD